MKLVKEAYYSWGAEVVFITSGCCDATIDAGTDAVAACENNSVVLCFSGFTDAAAGVVAAFVDSVTDSDFSTAAFGFVNKSSRNRCVFAGGSVASSLANVALSARGIANVDAGLWPSTVEEADLCTSGLMFSKVSKLLDVDNNR